MKMISGAQIVLEILKRMEVKDVFGYPGGAVIPIYDAIYDYKEINHYLARHEQGASHMADAYARVTGEVGVCIATSGPGATNLVTGIMTAYMDSAPVLAITGQVSSAFLGKDSFQEAHVTGIFASITKHNYLVKDIYELPQLLKEAFLLTKKGRHGPVLIDIPKDIQMKEIPYSEFERLFQLENPYLEQKYEVIVRDEKVEALQKMLKAAKKPVIVIGGGVVKSKARDSVLKLLEKTNAPSVSTLMGLGAVPHGQPGYLGMIGMHGSFEANTCVNESDLFVNIGMRFDDRIVGDVDRYAPNALKVHIDIDEAEIDKSLIVDLEVIGDAKEVLEKLLSKGDLGDHSEWRKKWLDVEYLKTETISKKIINDLSKIMPKDAIVTTDVGKHQMYTAQAYQFYNPNRFCTSGGAGTMGYGLPAAIGAQVGNPDSKVISISGDGGFQMNIQELILMREYNLPVKAFIFNNSSLGMVRQWQKLFNEERFSHVELGFNPDFLMVGQAYGIRSVKVETFEEYEKIKNLLLDDQPLIVEVIVPKEDDVFPIIPAGQSVAETIFSRED